MNEGVTYWRLYSSHFLSQEKHDRVSKESRVFDRPNYITKHDLTTSHIQAGRFLFVAHNEGTTQSKLITSFIGINNTERKHRPTLAHPTDCSGIILADHYRSGTREALPSWRFRYKKHYRGYSDPQSYTRGCKVSKENTRWPPRGLWQYVYLSSRWQMVVRTCCGIIN